MKAQELLQAQAEIEKIIRESSEQIIEAYKSTGHYGCLCAVIPGVQTWVQENAVSFIGIAEDNHNASIRVIKHNENKYEISILSGSLPLMFDIALNTEAIKESIKKEVERKK